MTYSKQTWGDKNSLYPASANRLTPMEQGIFDAHYKPLVLLTRNSAVSMAPGVQTAVTFDQETNPPGDLFSMHSLVNNTSRITLPATGLWLFNAYVEWAANAVGARGMALTKNGVIDGSNPGGHVSQQARTDGGTVGMTNPFVLWGLGGDYYELVISHTSTANPLTATVRLTVALLSW